MRRAILATAAAVLISGGATAKPTDPQAAWWSPQAKVVIHKKHHRPIHRDPGVPLKVAERQIASMKSDLANMRAELADVRSRIGASPWTGVSVPFIALELAKGEAQRVASLPDLRLPAQEPALPIPPSKATAEAPGAILRRVFPATATERGQWNDQRRTHRHAGIDLAGRRGSPIVASWEGRVLPSPGGDRGYGPHVLVVQGSDGVVYRYAHLETIAVKAGDRVATGQRIGTMGVAGGLAHLHFETIPLAEYRRRPYGVHSLDPNMLLGGSRGSQMAGGEPMEGQAVMEASAHVRNAVAMLEHHRRRK